MRRTTTTPLAIALALLIPAVATAYEDGEDPHEIVCETIHEPVPVARTVYVLEHYTRCYNPARAEASRLDGACALLIQGYGPAEGERRCAELIASLRVD